MVRYGQASFGGPAYDQLLAPGEAQARALGHAWAAQAVRFDRVYAGPLRRHQQTHDAAAAAYREHGLDWPDPVLLPQLNEHHGGVGTTLADVDRARSCRAPIGGAAPSGR